MGILETLKKDHAILKKYLKVLRKEDSGIESKIEAYSEMIPLLLGHAKAEEKSVYTFLKQSHELDYLGHEGSEEHHLMELLVTKINRTTDEDKWSARTKVLSDLVFHHLEEEEENLLPILKDQIDRQEDHFLYETYCKVRDRIIETKNISKDQERSNWMTAEL